MKRIVLILALVFTFNMVVVHAEIRQGNDNFTGGIRISSCVAVKNPIDTISLVKIISPGLVEYTLSANDCTSKDFSFSKTVIEMKVDNNLSHNIDILKVVSMPTDNRYLFLSTADVIVSSQIINEIKDAKRVAIRLQRLNGLYSVLVLPESTLTEWKQIINTEK